MTSPAHCSCAYKASSGQKGQHKSGSQFYKSRFLSIFFSSPRQAKAEELKIKRVGEKNSAESLGDGCYKGSRDPQRAVERARRSPTGLNRTGKSCRLRWVNYLHPGLKRGRMTPQEEQLVLQLHALHGNRWSHIARSLPGRTDNEIKNYWRTHMRKKAQERKRSSSPSSSGSMSSSSNECESSSNGGEGDGEGEIKVYPMDQLWNEIAATETVTELSSCNISCPSMPSPMWDYPSLWGMDEEECKIAY